MAVKVAQGATLLKGVEHYAGGGYPYWEAVAWAVLSVDTPCLARQGFEGILEHVVVQFVAECSRICTHELVRHRVASYAQTSTRVGSYHATRYSRFLAGLADEAGRLLEDCCGEDCYASLEQVIAKACIIPQGPVPERRLVVERCYEYISALTRARGEAADNTVRYAQPDALKAHIMVTTNLREILHIAQLRLHPHAHWEIRSLVEELTERLWSKHGIPIHLMLALKRPGLLKARRDLERLAEEQLNTLREHLQQNTWEKIASLYTNALNCTPG